MYNKYNKTAHMPMPSNIYYWWNFGSLLGMCLIIQLMTGFFLSFYYENNILYSFISIDQINRNINMGWLIHFLHANGASMFFMFIYLHIGRSMYFKSFNLIKVWNSGVVMLLILFMISFIGYVLPWGQMSFWGATVITNLLSSAPYVGDMLTFWLWGNYSVSKPTLMRFFSFHFILPFILTMLIIVHIIFLHNKGSNNPLGFKSNLDKISFNPYFTWKDLLSAMICLTIFIFINLTSPYMFMDPDNFTPANPMNTPPHIQPEWYFLFAYAILRSIPNKLGGVIALLSSILILLTLPLMNKNSPTKHNYLFKISFFYWMMNFIYLTKMGAKPIEAPFNSLTKMSSLIYFIYFIIYI